MPFFQKDLPLPMLKPCSRPPSAPRAVTCGNLHLRTSVHLWHIKRMCLGTFSRLARSLATIYIFARVRIIGMLVPFLCNREFLRISYYTKRDGTQLVPGLSTVSLFLTAVRHAGPDQPSVSYTFLTFLRISQKSNVAK